MTVEMMNMATGMATTAVTMTAATTVAMTAATTVELQ